MYKIYIYIYTHIDKAWGLGVAVVGVVGGPLGGLGGRADVFNK